MGKITEYETTNEKMLEIADLFKEIKELSNSERIYHITSLCGKDCFGNIKNPTELSKRFLKGRHREYMYLSDRGIDGNNEEWYYNREGDKDFREVDMIKINWDEIEKDDELLDALINVLKNYIKRSIPDWGIKKYKKVVSDEISPMVRSVSYEFDTFLSNILTGLYLENPLISMKSNDSKSIVCFFPDKSVCSSWSEYDFEESLKNFLSTYTRGCKFSRNISDVTGFTIEQMLNDGNYEIKEIETSFSEDIPLKVYSVTLKPYDDGTYMKRGKEEKVLKIDRRKDLEDGVQKYVVRFADMYTFYELYFMIEDFYNGDVPEESQLLKEEVDKRGNKKYIVKDGFYLNDPELIDKIFFNMLRYKKYRYKDRVYIKILN